MSEAEKTITTEEQQQQTEEQHQQTAESPYVVKLKKPFTFEKKQYTEIDLSGLENLTIQDAVDAQKSLFEQQEVASALVCETTTAFAMEIACKASGLPIEFFKTMPIGAGRAVKHTVKAFINVKNKGKGNVLRLEKPYSFKGEQFEEFDLSAIGEMSVMNESAAENAMAREGFVITENSFNYLYACIIAGMAVKKPKELFTGLPLNELLKLKETVNSADFFE